MEGKGTGGRGKGIGRAARANSRKKGPITKRSHSRRLTSWSKNGPRGGKELPAVYRGKKTIGQKRGGLMRKSDSDGQNAQGSTAGSEGGGRKKRFSGRGESLSKKRKIDIEN